MGWYSKEHNLRMLERLVANAEVEAVLDLSGHWFLHDSAWFIYRFGQWFTYGEGEVRFASFLVYFMS
jgi:hypothetical protein